MARIPDEVVECLKSEISLQHLIEGQGVKLKKHGQDYLGLCPFHEDRSPSLVISPQKNLWHCLGACQSGGSVIDWVMKVEGVSFRHAVELLQSNPPSTVSKPVKYSTTQKIATPFQRDIEDQQLLNQVVDYYHQTLKQSPEAQAYLEKRGLVHPELIKTFKLGFANRSLSYRLPGKKTKDGAAIRGQLQRIGLFRETGHEHFNGSLVIPVFDEQGNVTEVYGRKITRKLRPGTPLHLYLPGAHQGIFNLEVLKNHQEIILCESLIDALTFWCAGFRNVTCSYGIEGFTGEHLNVFKQNNIKRVLIAYDRDDAGNKAAEKLSKQLIKAGLDCYRIHFPKGMDANEYSLQVQPPERSLEVVIKSALWLGTGQRPALTNRSRLEDKQDITAKHKKETSLSNPLVAESIQPEPPIETAQRIPDKPEGRSCASMHSRHTVHPVHNIEAEVTDEEVKITLGDRHYRVRGLGKNLSYDMLKVNVLVTINDVYDVQDAQVSRVHGCTGAIHVDTFDLYSARHRAIYIKQAAGELELKEDIIKKDLAKVLMKLELLQQQNIEATLQPKAEKNLSNEEHDAALALLQSPDLLNRILCDFKQCGVVGEETNKLLGYLACVSRKLDMPLAIIVQSTSAAGKSSLMDAIIRMMPEEERVQYSAMTGQSLFYMGETNLKHKILAIAEEEGASNASYALKLLQSEGELTIASTGKDDDTGNLITKEYRVEGPVMLFLTTTAIDIDEELMNRCLVLTVDENRAQTKAIHQHQRKQRTLEGLLSKQNKQQLLTLHHNAQRLLKPLSVVNPYAEQLTFLDDRTRTRRDHEKYLTLIESITLLHQCQREIKTITHDDNDIEYVEVTTKDIEIANQLANDILGRTLDELPPQTRRLLELIHMMVTEQCTQQSIEQHHYHFSRRQIRDYSNWGDTQCRVHLERLVSMEYIIVHRGSRGQTYVYELLYQGEGQTGEPFLQGLIDVTSLKTTATTKSSRAKPPKLAGSLRPQRGGSAGSSRTKKNDGKRYQTKATGKSNKNKAKSTSRLKKDNGQSYAGQDSPNVAGAGRTRATIAQP